MKVAVITVFCNDEYRLDACRRYYEEYKHDVALHIVVDNNSRPEIRSKIKAAFPDSVFIERDNNMCIGAYNAGLKYAMSRSEIDAFMILVNDVRLGPNAIPELYEYLFSDDRLGIVAPILLNKDTNTVQVFGFELNFWWQQKNRFFGKEMDDPVIPETHTVAYVSGGVCMAKRKFYEQLDLMDETLYMYSEELDMGLKARKKGLLEGTTRKVHAWHQHIPAEPGENGLDLNAMLNRNNVYILRKEAGLIPLTLYLINTFWTRGIRFIYHIANPQLRRKFYSTAYGIWLGLANKMDVKYCSIPTKKH